MTTLTPSTGCAAIRAEMSRQHSDARASFAAAQPLAAEIAASVRRTGRLTLLGMGGSHWVNRTAAVLYRRAGLDVSAEVLSEALFTPLPPRPRTVLIVSQSGGSGEIAPYLDRRAETDQRFGLTLDPDGPLARRIPSLCGVGGPERAFAATRSIMVSLSLHLAVLQALGEPVDDALAVLDAPAAPKPIGAAVSALAKAESFVISGRAELQGVAESGALCIMELARLPALALEGGQLRHGPMEMLSGRVGVVLLRASGPSAALTPALAAACAAAGCPVVVFDVSGEPAIAHATTIPFTARQGMAAVFDVLPALQEMLVEVAARRITDVGQPVRSNKVTRDL